MRRLNVDRSEGPAAPMKDNLVAAAAALSLSVACLTGCTSEDRHPKPGPVAAAPRSASSPAVMTVSEAGKTYLKLSAASNAARDAWMHAPALTTANLAKHRRLAAHAADATVAFAQGLRQRRWPSQAQPYVTALDEQLRERGRVPACRGRRHRFRLPGSRGTGPRDHQPHRHRAQNPRPAGVCGRHGCDSGIDRGPAAPVEAAAGLGSQRSCGSAATVARARTHATGGSRSRVFVWRCS